ncbi:hypothetical protein PoB_003308400 [Plakobranchus ocellatus]|uniref:Uncharacterized protein n=1 Tax=Plakobranchus ocellatus TaxID=259542 RepID=A0AAV4AJG4_9GAST|nr:hypothetical protein PoB_003308400 [Plakobranchus ocellatus]
MITRPLLVPTVERHAGVDRDQLISLNKNRYAETVPLREIDAEVVVEVLVDNYRRLDSAAEVLSGQRIK